MDGIKRGMTARHLYIAAALFALLVAPALLVDVRLARSGRLEGLPGDLRRVLGWAELFAHGLGVAIIGLTVFVLDRAHRRYLWRTFAGAYGAGLAANLLKATLARTRPSAHDLTLGVQRSFVGWFPSPADWEYSIQSFPSGHTTVAVALAIGLTRLYPRGKWLFFRSPRWPPHSASQREPTGSAIPSPPRRWHCWSPACSATAE